MNCESVPVRALPTRPAVVRATGSPLGRTPRTRLRIGAANDPLEHATDHAADAVMPGEPVSVLTSTSAAARRACAAETEKEDLVQRECATCEIADENREGAGEAAASAVAAGGRPLSPELRAYFEPRFGRDFSDVRVHTHGQAANAADAIRARAYTLGSHVAFASGEFAPARRDGRRLIAHELAHVAQQDHSASHRDTVRRVIPGNFLSSRAEGDAARVDDTGLMARPGRSDPLDCPPTFCQPYPSLELARRHRARNAGWILNGIATAIGYRVRPLWSLHISGGSPPLDLSRLFGTDFTDSPTTLTATIFLRSALTRRLITNPPPVVAVERMSLESLIPEAVAALNGPMSPNRMNFDGRGDIAGNLAGDIGIDQTLTRTGAQPSPFNDMRHAVGEAFMVRTSDRRIRVSPIISYTVRDTIDLCPGNCGSPLEQVATVPLSRFEASGISGDLPFYVYFRAPDFGPFDITAPLPTSPSNAPIPASLALPSPEPMASYSPSVAPPEPATCHSAAIP
jgi:hypothetical protein